MQPPKRRKISVKAAKFKAEQRQPDDAVPMALSFESGPAPTYLNELAFEPCEEAAEGEEGGTGERLLCARTVRGLGLLWGLAL